MISLPAADSPRAEAGRTALGLLGVARGQATRDAVEQVGQRLADLPAELRISPDVRRVLGRAPRPFADWAARNVAAFR
ncbi:hypothetical protein [Streptomyces sp. SP17BM10]|uniref:hypothetical protein n=1 Tax=Streptomyces sp. SP17BM10 TaxID=3002530 RepID=UPI003FCC8957